MALTQAESGILHVNDHHRHQYHHDEVYDVEHHSRAMSYDILRCKIKRYKLRPEVSRIRRTWQHRYQNAENVCRGVRTTELIVVGANYNK